LHSLCNLCVSNGKWQMPTLQTKKESKCRSTIWCSLFVWPSASPFVVLFHAFKIKFEPICSRFVWQGRGKEQNNGHLKQLHILKEPFVAIFTFARHTFCLSSSFRITAAQQMYRAQLHQRIGKCLWPSVAGIRRLLCVH